MMQCDVVRLVGILMPILAVPTLLAQTEGVTYHDLAAMQTSKLGNMQVKGAVGESHSLAVAEMPPGARGRAGNPHHHNQEQIVLGVSGSTVFSAGGLSYRLGVHGAAVTPANVEHFQLNGSTTTTSTFIEFQPVLRRDWFPPYPVVESTRSAAPAAVASSEQVFTDFGAAAEGWQSGSGGARSKVLNGQTIRVTVCDLSAAGASLTLEPRRESFVYVLEGHVEVVTSAGRREVGSEMLLVVSAQANDVRFASLNKGRTLIAVFDSIVR